MAFNRGSSRVLKHHINNAISVYGKKEDVTPNPNDDHIKMIIQERFDNGVCYSCRGKSRLRVGMIGSQSVKFCKHCQDKYQADRQNNIDL